MSEPVVVVGAGAAGIIAAWRAASLGRPVVLLEKTNRIGTKILISGGGKCNITHEGPIEDVLKAFRPNEARFIRPACYRFKNTEIVDLLTSRGLEVYTRPDGRIFPVHQTAKDVVAILRCHLDEVGVDLRLQAPVRAIQVQGLGRLRVLLSEGEAIESKAVVVATGGSSYPASGTSGDGWEWMRRLGHSIASIRAALAPIELDEPMSELAGVALRDVVLKGRQGKSVPRWRGDLLFTHRGISGPATLGVSREVAEILEQGSVVMEVDLCPEASFETLGESLRSFVQSHPRKRIESWVGQFAPGAACDRLMGVIAPNFWETPSANVPQKQRNRLIELLKGWQLGRVTDVVLDKGEVVAGGVALNEVDAQTMESKLVPGLFLCGEVLDIAGPVGGYNLQAAFATGFVAGSSAAARTP